MAGGDVGGLEVDAAVAGFDMGALDAAAGLALAGLGMGGRPKLVGALAADLLIEPAARASVVQRGGLGWRTRMEEEQWPRGKRKRKRRRKNGEMQARQSQAFLCHNSQWQQLTGNGFVLGFACRRVTRRCGRK